MLEQPPTLTYWPELEPLRKRARTLTLERGQFLYHEGDTLEHFYLLEQGTVRRFKIAPDGRRELTLERIGAGSLMLDPGLFLMPASASCCCTALEPCVLLGFPMSAVLERMTHSPLLGSRLLTGLAEQQSHLLGQLERWQFWDLGARLGAHLLEQDRLEGQELPTNSVLAALLGTVPELVSRKLGEFYRAGYIRLERRRLWITDYSALESIVRS